MAKYWLCHGVRWLAVVVAARVLATAAGASDVEAPAKSDFLAWLEPYALSELPAGPPVGWVDAQRWAAAHARLECGILLDEANRYFSEIQFVST